MNHPTIKLFQGRAQLLDAAGSPLTLDDAISKLAIWMDIAAEHLTEDDWAALGEIGGILYREGLNRRLPPDLR